MDASGRSVDAELAAARTNLGQLPAALERGLRYAVHPEKLPGASPELVERVAASQRLLRSRISDPQWASQSGLASAARSALEDYAAQADGLGARNVAAAFRSYADALLWAGAGELARGAPVSGVRLPSSAKAWVLAVLSFLFFEFSSSSTVNGETTSETKIVIPFGLIFAVWCFLTIRAVARRARNTGQTLPRAYRFAGVVSAVGVTWLVVFSLKEMVFQMIYETFVGYVV